LLVKITFGISASKDNGYTKLFMLLAMCQLESRHANDITATFYKHSTLYENKSRWCAGWFVIV